MSLLTNSLHLGKITGVVYTFEKAGDVLPMHTHTSGTEHITIVARGKVKIHGNEWEMEKSAGAIIDFPSEQSHEFVALENDTRIVNIIK